MKKTMTLTEGLSVLKLFDKKIEKVLNKIELNGVVDYKKSSDDVCMNTNKNVEKLKKETISFLDKYKSLSKNKDILKAAIAQANATTNVKIAGKEYTIVEAIERKRTIETDKRLLEIIKYNYAEVTDKINHINENAQRQANNIIETKVGAEAKNSKTDDINSLYDLIYEKNKVELIDPLKVEDLINTLEEEIEEFEQSVDVNLSVANARTEITIDFDGE